MCNTFPGKWRGEEWDSETVQTPTVAAGNTQVLLRHSLRTDMQGGPRVCHRSVNHNQISPSPHLATATTHHLRATRRAFRGGAWGGGGSDAFSSQGLDPLTNQRVPSLVLFYDIHFRPTNSKVFLKASSALIYFNFKGERAAKKRHFLSKFCQLFFWST